MPPPAAAFGVIVVGSGVAGLRAALTLAETRSVLLLTKTVLGGGASARAQGGIAAALGPDDSPALHARDTLNAGAGRCDPVAVDVLATRGPGAVGALARLGARFDRDARGDLALAREAAHSRPRVLHAGGDATGAELLRALAGALSAARAAGRLTVLERCFAGDLVVAAGRCVGVTAWRDQDGWRWFAAPAVLLATGGAGRVYAHTTNPPECTGDGLAMALRAGVRLAEMEFVQFHPTALADGSDPMPLISEAVRGEGAVLRDETGRRFLAGAHPLAELAPRDVVARAIWRHRREEHRVALDATERPGAAFPDRFPTIFAWCRARGLDPTRQPLPVAPAAHYLMGGIATDLDGRSSLPGLWACGEAACTRVHGANRLASNSLLEAIVFAERAAQNILGATAPHGSASAPAAADPSAAPQAGDVALPAAPPFLATDAGVSTLVGRLRALMWTDVGLERTARGLTRALAGLAAIAAALPRGCGEPHNLVRVARAIAEAALARPDSCGAHWRADGAAPPAPRRAG